MSDPESWRWVWLAATFVFGVGELFMAGSFFLAPFALGAGVAAVLAFAGLGLGIQWTAFLVVSGGTFLALRPLARRLDQDGATPLGVGAHRQVGQVARVISPIDGANDTGTVLLGGEHWRAESIEGQVVPVGSLVSVVEVRGTRLVVRLDPTAPRPAADPAHPADQPPA